MNKILSKSFLYCLFFTFALKTFGAIKEKTQTEISNVIEIPEKSTGRTSLISANKNTVYLIQQIKPFSLFSKTKIYDKIVLYDYKTLTPNKKEIIIYSAKEKSPTNNKLSSNYKLIETKNSFIQFFTEYDSRKKTYNYFYRIFSKNLEKVKELSVAFKESNPRNKYTELDISLNEDSTGIYFLIEGARSKDENEKLRIIQINEDGDVYKSNEVQFPRVAKNFSVNKIFVTKKEKFIVTAYVNVPKKEKNEGGYGTINAVYTFDKNDDKAKEFIPSYDNDVDNVYGVRYAINENEVKLAGFCSSKSIKGISGLIAKTFNIETETWGVENFTKFTQDIISSINKANNGHGRNVLVIGKPKANAGLSFNYKILDIYDQKEGSLMVCQNQYSYTRTVTDKYGTTRTYVYYVFADYIIFKFDESGKLKWYNTQNQYIESQNPNPYLSNYPMFPEEDGISFLVNNLGVEKSDTKKSFLNLNRFDVETAILTFQSGNKPQTKTIKSNSSTDYSCNLRTSIRIENDAYLMLGQYKKRILSKKIKKGAQILVKATLE